MYLSAKRVVRTFGALFLMLSAVLWTAFFVVNSLTGIAKELVEKALARYNNFTGKLALQNFPEDKILYQQVQNLQESLLPFLDLLSPVLVVFSIVFSVVTLLCFVFPKQCATLLVQIKIWKFLPQENEGASTQNLSVSIPWKKILLATIPIVFVVFLTLMIRSCSSISSEKAGEELEKAALVYVEYVKSGFANNKKINVPDSLPSSEIFSFEIKKGRFVGTLKEPIENCKAGNAWTISPSVKGLFKKTLSIYRKPPADSSCQFISPDFKNIGR